MMAQKSIAKTPIPDAFTGRSGYWWYGATCAAVFESAERFSKAQPPQGWHSPLLRRYRKEPLALRFTFTGMKKAPLRLYLQSGELCRARLTSPPDLLTGYSYFGSRYLDHELMTMCLSVDPMADKYPSISHYVYCSWNPVKLVDPNGEKWRTAGDFTAANELKPAVKNRMNDISIIIQDNKRKIVEIAHDSNNGIRKYPYKNK